MTAPVRISIALAAALAGAGACKGNSKGNSTGEGSDPPVAGAPLPPVPGAASGAAPTAPPPAGWAPVDLPLAPERQETVAANRTTLDTMSASIQCPQQLPSAFAKYCAAAADFTGGTAAEPAPGTTVLIGEAAIIQPGPPSMSTLGTPNPVVLVLERTGDEVKLAQKAIRSPDPDKTNAMPIVVARIGKVLDGKWDHVDVPAELADQVAAAKAGPYERLEVSGGSYWVHDLDGFELRRGNGHWIGVSAPEGPDGVHVIMVFVDQFKQLAPGEKSPQEITVMKL